MKMEKIIIKKENLPKLRIPIHKIKPEQTHKSKKDYSRQKEKEKLKDRIKKGKLEDF